MIFKYFDSVQNESTDITYSTIVAQTLFKIECIFCLFTSLQNIFRAPIVTDVS